MFTNEWSKKYAEVAATRHAIAAVKDKPAASSNGGSFVDTGVRATAPMLLSDQVGLMAFYM